MNVVQGFYCPENAIGVWGQSSKVTTRSLNYNTIGTLAQYKSSVKGKCNLKETAKQYIEVDYRIFISVLFGEIF